MDQMVLKTQQWLNRTYGLKPGFKRITEDGITGWGTMKALITALQFELNIPLPNGVFGPATTETYNEKIKALSQNLDAEKTNLNFIVQGALYCKGYNPFEFNGSFTELTKQAIISLQSDAGLSNTDGSIDVVLMKSLLSMDAFKLLNYGSYNGKEIIRTIQQYLNKKYISNQYFASDIGLVPCDGIYGRSTNKALLYGLQIEEGIPVPNGVFGPKTKELCPTIPSKTNEARFVYLLQAALYCNGEDPKGFDGGFGNGAMAAVKNFQFFSELTADGYCGKQTWASLLVSTGDPLRKGKACDTKDIITDARAKTLINDGRLYVGRYLTGRYRLTSEELNVIYKNNLKLIPLMQVLGTESWNFNYSSGLRDAFSALTVSRFHGLASGTLIYFAIDYDALTSDLSEYIEPYFKAINEAFNDSSLNPNKYRIGVYAPRAICSALYKKGYTSSSYVSDMSTGFSSNLGARLPENWSFDQIYEYPNGIGSNEGHLALDNVIARTGHIEYCSSVDTKYSSDGLLERINSTPLLKAIGIEVSGLGSLVFIDRPDLKVSVDVSTKAAIGNEPYSTFQIKNGEFDGVEFQSELSKIKSSLSAEGEAQLSTSIASCENVDATIKFTTSPTSIKVEVESEVNAKDIVPFPLIVTLCIEIKKNDNKPLKEQVNEVVTAFNKLAYNTVNGAVNIGKKVINFLGYILMGVAIAATATVIILAFLAGAVEVAGAAIFVLLSGIVLKLLNNDSTAV